jgi:hypothetical protein
MRLRRLPLAVLFVLMPGLAPCLSHAVTITVGSATVNLGDTVTIPVSITDVVGLEFFDFSLSFDPLILQANVAGATAGAFLPGDWFFTSPGTVDNTNGQILGVSAFGSPVSGSGVIADLEFTATGVGVSPLSFFDVFVNLSQEGFELVNGQVTVQAVVPEPSTVALLSLGLGALGVRQWRRQRS